MTRVSRKQSPETANSQKTAKAERARTMPPILTLWTKRSLKDPGVNSATGSFTNAYTIEEKAKKLIPLQTVPFEAGKESNKKRLKKFMCRSGSMQNEEQPPVCRLIQSKNAVPGRKCNHAD